jgi:ADP-heptose:LPS heptosyltransferase
MSPSARRGTLVLFPGALGDLLCCWPVLDALRAGAALTLAAREAWLAALPEDAVTGWSIDRRELADLFGTAPMRTATHDLLAGFARVESWTGFGDQNFTRRLDEACGGVASVHPFRALRQGEHASEYYGRCVGVVPKTTHLPIRRAAAAWADALWRRELLGGDVLTIHPGSGSPRKNWEGMADTAAAWRARGGRVVVLAGPAEETLGHAVPHDAAIRDQPLDRIAAVLARSRCYLGNDSGISHLAGMVGARGVALFGPTDPVAWRPLGETMRVVHRPGECRRCGGDRFCAHRLAVDEVLVTLRAHATA